MELERRHEREDRRVSATGIRNLGRDQVTIAGLHRDGAKQNSPRTAYVRLQWDRGSAREVGKVAHASPGGGKSGRASKSG